MSESRILADFTDDADFRDSGDLSGYCLLRRGDGVFVIRLFLCYTLYNLVDRSITSVPLSVESYPTP